MSLTVYRCGPLQAFAAKKVRRFPALDGFHLIGRNSRHVRARVHYPAEIIGNGTLFDGADALLGSWAKVLRVEIFPHRLPLSCWRCLQVRIGTGLMLAGKYLIDERMKSAVLEAAARTMHCQTVETGECLMNKPKRSGDHLTRLREDNPSSHHRSLISVRLLNC